MARKIKMKQPVPLAFDNDPKPKVKKKPSAYQQGFDAYKRGIAGSPSLDSTMKKLTVETVKQWEEGWKDAATAFLAAI